jgi:hypothetical protein
MSDRRWHEALGAFPDDAMAFLHEEATGEPLTSEAVRFARRRRGIPPYSEPHRSRWYESRGLTPEPPPDIDLDW